MTVNTRPPYGRRLLPAVLDEFAQTTPGRLYAAIPRSNDVTDGFRDVTFAEIARAVDFMANWIINRHGYSNNFETISFVGIADLRGPIVFLAAVKAGYKVLLPSPRNPPAVNVSLMEQTGSTKLLHAAEMASITQKLVALNPRISGEVVPSFDEMLSTSAKHVPFLKNFDEARNDPIVVLHSSGSTGNPKPITMTHGSMAVIDNEHNISDVPGRRRLDWSKWTFDGEARVYTVFPFFHLAGFLAYGLHTIFMNSSPVLGPPNLIPDGTLLRNFMTHQKLRAIFLPPAVIEQVLHEPDGINFFKDLDFLAYSGAPFNPEAGDRLARVVELFSPYGSTETYAQPELAPISREDWAWHEFNPTLSSEMRLYDEDEGTYEYVVIADETHKDTCAVYHNLPGVKEYFTKDLFTRHPDPEKPNLYKYYGRRDDIIVLANGEKFNPIPAEMSISGHPALKGAFLTGNGRTESLLLVEPAVAVQDTTARDALLNEIWPLVEKSNALIAGQGRVSRERILCASPDKPFTRTPKGTIVRKLTQDLYRDEIDAAYSTSTSQQNNGGAAAVITLTPVVKTTYKLPMVTNFLRTIMAASYPQAQEMAETDDLFNHGLDSIQTLEIVTSLKRNLSSAQTDGSRSVSWLTPRVIFKHSNIAELSQVIQKFLNEGEIPQEDSRAARVKRVNDAVAQYTRGLPERTRGMDISNTSSSSSSSSSKSTGKRNVALVGSTGYMGNHLLVKLLRDPRVGKIYCLNRSSDARERQEAVLGSLLPAATATDDTSLYHDRITYLRMDISQPRLGLADEAYNAVVEEADVLIYNAWRLDFGISLRSFDPFLRATRSLVDLSIASRRDPHVVFVSSISSVGALAQRQGRVDEGSGSGAKEELVDDPLVAWDFGYADSKHVAERILGVASDKAGVRVSIVRLGQIGGPSRELMKSLSGNIKGMMWTEQPWISALIRTAKVLRTLPESFTMISWFPVDTAAEMLRDVAVSEASLEKSQEGLRVYHVVHADPQPWDLFVRVVGKKLGLRTGTATGGDGDEQSLTTQPLLEWTDTLRAILQGRDDEARKLNGNGVKISPEAVPAVKMIDFYDSLGSGADDARWAGERVAEVSTAEYPPLDEQLLGMWLHGWNV